MADNNIMREDDDAPEGRQPAPERVNGEAALRPVTDPPIRRGADEKAAKEEFEILEVDDQDQPIGGDQPRGDEGRLSEGEAGERSLLEKDHPADGDKSSRRGRQDREETNQERRARQKLSRERARTENVALKRELEQLRGELNEFRSGTDRRLSQVDDVRIQTELRTFDEQIEKQNQIIRETETATRKALSPDSNDADAFIAAQTKREEAVIAKARLEARRDSLKDNIAKAQNADRAEEDGDERGRRGAPREQERQRQEPKSRPISQEVQRFVDTFQSKYDWINPKSGNAEIRRDSNRILFLDNELASEGYDPGTREYWDELEARMEEVLPHLFDDEDDRAGRKPNGSGARPNGHGARQMNGAANNGNGTRGGSQQQQQRRGPAVAGVGGGGSQSKTQVRISPERKRALIDTGSLDTNGRVLDAAKFERQLRNFADYDALNAPRR